jgi:predicted Zn-dependent protease with MMP-like domain
MPRRIILFLDNILEQADGDPAAFRAEVRDTLLHELGHYLGLDEDDLIDRGLE